MEMHTLEELLGKSERPKVVDKFVGEYEALKKSLNLKDPIISYPACGSDTSLSEAFPTSRTCYIDNEEKVIAALKAAGLGPNNHFIHGSAYDYEIPEPFDLVVLRSPTTDTGDVPGLTRGLKKGGYVIESNWGSTEQARQLLSDPQFKLVGEIGYKEDKSEFVLEKDNDGDMSKKLANDKGIFSKLHDKSFVFQKIR
jgi:hypothetical protein